MGFLNVKNGGVWEVYQTPGKGLTKNNIIKYSAHNRETFRGMLQAKQAGFDFTECDVANNTFTSDGVPIVCHESSVAGLTIANETLATIPGIGSVSAPTLQEYLQLTRLMNIGTIIDTKNLSNTDYQDQIIKVINSFANVENIIILTGSIAATEKMAIACPRSRVYYLTVPTASATVEAIAALKQYNNKVGFSINGHGLTTLEQNDNIKAAGLEIGFWNATPENYSTLAAFNPYYMGFDATIEQIKTAEKSYLNSLDLFGQM